MAEYRMDLLLPPWVIGVLIRALDAEDQRLKGKAKDEPDQVSAITVALTDLHFARWQLLTQYAVKRGVHHRTYSARFSEYLTYLNREEDRKSRGETTVEELLGEAARKK